MTPQISATRLIRSLLTSHPHLSTQQIFQLGTQNERPILQVDHEINADGRIRMKKVANMREGRRPWQPAPVARFPEHPFRSVNFLKTNILASLHSQELIYKSTEERPFENPEEERAAIQKAAKITRRLERAAEKQSTAPPAPAQPKMSVTFFPWKLGPKEEDEAWARAEHLEIAYHANRRIEAEEIEKRRTARRAAFAAEREREKAEIAEDKRLGRTNAKMRSAQRTQALVKIREYAKQTGEDVSGWYEELGVRMQPRLERESYHQEDRDRDEQDTLPEWDQPGEWREDKGAFGLRRAGLRRDQEDSQGGRGDHGFDDAARPSSSRSAVSAGKADDIFGGGSAPRSLAGHMPERRPSHSPSSETNGTSGWNRPPSSYAPIERAYPPNNRSSRSRDTYDSSGSSTREERNAGRASSHSTEYNRDGRGETYGRALRQSSPVEGLDDGSRSRSDVAVPRRPPSFPSVFESEREREPERSSPSDFPQSRQRPDESENRDRARLSDRSASGSSYGTARSAASDNREQSSMAPGGFGRTPSASLRSSSDGERREPALSSVNESSSRSYGGAEQQDGRSGEGYRALLSRPDRYSATDESSYKEPSSSRAHGFRKGGPSRYNEPDRGHIKDTGSDTERLLASQRPIDPLRKAFLGGGPFASGDRSNNPSRTSFERDREEDGGRRHSRPSTSGRAPSRDRQSANGRTGFESFGSRPTVFPPVIKGEPAADLSPPPEQSWTGAPGKAFGVRG